MRSADRFHSPAPEALMEYVDGEGTVAARAAIEAHLADCEACRALVDEQRGLSAALGSWQVTPAPDSLNAPVARAARRWWRPTPTIAAGLSAAAIVLIAVAVNQRPAPPTVRAELSADPLAVSREVPPTLAAPGPQAQANESVQVDRLQPAVPQAFAKQGAPRSPSVIRTATLQIVAKDFAGVRTSVESMVAAAAGFLDHLTLTGDTDHPRVLRGALRVPADQLGGVLNQLRGLGQVIEDTQGSQDVTDQLVDLDARLASARATEQRLTALLRDRTGRLSDVLEVERELTRVRLDIERLDAEKTNVTRRVTYATINVTISEERKASLDGPLSLSTTLKIAALDGIESALDSIVAVALFVLRAGPSLLFWGGLAALGWMAFRRIKDSPTPTASE